MREDWGQTEQHKNSVLSLFASELETMILAQVSTASEFETQDVNFRGSWDPDCLEASATHISGVFYSRTQWKMLCREPMCDIRGKQPKSRRIRRRRAKGVFFFLRLWIIIWVVSFEKCHFFPGPGGKTLMRHLSRCQRPRTPSLRRTWLTLEGSCRKRRRLGSNLTTMGLVNLSMEFFGFGNFDLEWPKP